MTAIYREGIESRERGQPKSDNPYPAYTEAWAWHRAGWNDKDIALSK